MNEFKSPVRVIGSSKGDSCYYPLQLDTYGKGCQHNCSYCYGRNLLEVRKMWDATNPSIANVDKIEKIFIDAFEKDKSTKWASILKRRVPIRLGGMTDVFQPIEVEHGITKRMLEILDMYDYPYLIITKSDLIAEPEYIDTIRKDLCAVQVTINSDYEPFNAAVESGAPGYERRINAVKKLVQENILTQVRMGPIFPLMPDGYMQDSKQATKILRVFSYDMVKDICELKPDTVIAEFLRLSPLMKKWLAEAGYDMTEHFNEYSRNIGGAKHFSVAEKEIYYNGIRRLCSHYDVDFTICDQVDHEHFRSWWSNPDDCCNLLGKLPAFNKTWRS